MILVVDFGSSKVPFISDFIDEYMDVTLIKFNELETINPNDYLGIVFSGAPILLSETDPAPYLNKTAWLKDYEKPFLGICFGHQILGLTYGASVTRQKEDRDWQTIEILQEDSLFDKFPQEFEMMEDHCETVSIPPNFIHLGVSDACINEVMKHKEKPLYGVQFHPEVSGNLGSLLFNNFVNICERFKQEQIK